VAGLNMNGLQVPVFQDFVVVFKGQAVIPMLFLNPGGPFPQDVEGSVVQRVTGRA